jgi:hypothetical protein
MIDLSDTFQIPKVNEMFPRVGYVWITSPFSSTSWQDCCMNHDGSTFVVAESSGGAGRLWYWFSGTSWKVFYPTGDTAENWISVCCDYIGNKIIAVTNNGHVWCSTNRGVDWTELDPTGTTGVEVWARVRMSGDGLVILLGTAAAKLWLSKDGGTTWAETKPAGEANGNWKNLAVNTDGEYMIAASYTGRLFITNDCADTWVERSPIGDYLTKAWWRCCISNDGLIMYVTIYNGRVYRSLDGGVTWAEVVVEAAADYPWYAIECSWDAQVIYIARNLGSAWMSLDGGDSWAISGISSANCYGTCVSDDGKSLGVICNNSYIWYSLPATSTEPVPIVYGALIDGSKPIWKCPFIGATTSMFWYAYAAHTVMSVNGGNEVIIYKDGVALLGSAYNFYPCYSWGGITFALITFSTSQGTSTISAQGSGKWNGVTGECTDNIVDILDDFLAVECGMADIIEGASNLLTGWTNVSYGTFTTSGPNVTSAIWSVGEAYACSNSLYLSTGKRYKLTCNIKRISGASGAWPTFYMCAVDHTRIQELGGGCAYTGRYEEVNIYFIAIAGSDHLEVVDSVAVSWKTETFTLYEMAEIDLDASSKAATKQLFTSQQYTAAGVQQEDMTYWDIMTEMMGSFLGWCYMNGEGVPTLSIDDGVTSQAGAIVVPRSEAPLVEARMRRENLINQIRGDFAYNYLDSEFSIQSETTDCRDLVSQGVFGIREPDPYEFPWCRDITSVKKMQDIIVSRYKDPCYEIEVQDQSLKRLYVDVGDVIAYSADSLYDKLGSPLRNQLWRVISVMPDFEKAMITFRALQTQYYLTVPTNHILNGNMETWSGGAAHHPDSWTLGGSIGPAIAREDGLSLYNSDFSAGEDSWTATQGTAAGNIDSIGGLNDWLRYTCNAANAVHRLNRALATMVVGESYRLTFTYYIPTSNSILSALTVNSGTGTYNISAVSGLAITNTATVYTVDFTCQETGFMIYGNNAAVFQDAGGDDVFYIKDFKCERTANMVKNGSYSAKLTCGTVDGYLYQDVHTVLGIDYWKGKTITFGAWVWCAVGSTAELIVMDGVLTSPPNWHTGTSNWQWMTVTATIDAAATSLSVLCYIRYNASSQVAYFDQAVLVEGTYIDPAMYPLSGITRDMTVY